MIRIERAAAFWLRREASSMVQGDDQVQRAPCPFSSPVLGPPETSPSCISSSPVCARHSAWPCRWWGSIGGGQRATQEWLASFGLAFFFLIQKHHLHPAVKYFGILLGFVFLMWFNAADAPAAHPLAASEAA